MGTPVKNVKIVGFDIVQNAFIKHRRCSHSKTAIGMEQSNPGHCLFIETAGTRDLETHKITPALVHLCLCYVAFIQAKSCQLILWQVEPVSMPIFTHIAQDVGELQSHAQLYGIGYSKVI